MGHVRLGKFSPRLGHCLRIFPAYYNSITRSSDGISRINILGIYIENTAAYSINLGLAFGIIAHISPLLSSISDYS